MTSVMDPSVDGDVGNRSRRSSLSGDDDTADFDFLSDLKEQAIRPIKEDLAEWLAKILCIDITADNFVETLTNGVDVCRLAEIIHKKAETAAAKREFQGRVPSTCVKYKANAKVGTWFARDNTAAFIKWCNEFGVKQECLFETEGLVLQKDPRTVVLCILELARLGAKCGLEPPNLVRMENEIDRELSSANSGSSQSLSSISSSHSGSGQSKRKGSGSSAPKGNKLDSEVHKITGECSCKPTYVVNKISEGRYNIGGKNMFIRLLKDRHVMVRVGGGWDTLDHYLLKHDPCKITEFRRGLAQGDGKYVHVRGKYRST